MTLPDQLRAKARKLEEVASSLNAAADGLEAVSNFGEIKEPNTDASPMISLFGKTNGSMRKDYSSLSGIDFIAEILEENNRAMTREEIAEKLKGHGRDLSENTIQSYLSRDKRFENVGRGVWKLRPQTDLELSGINKGDNPESETLP